MIHNLSLLLVDASVGTIQCLEEIVSPLGLLRIPQLQLEAVSCVGRSAQLHKDVGESFPCLFAVGLRQLSHCVAQAGLKLIVLSQLPHCSHSGVCYNTQI